MSDQESEVTPFKTLGVKLQRMRKQLKESVAEVSGAVEIDEKTLQRIEQGSERPSEDILLLLITHFGMPDDEAVNLWELAGYDNIQQLKTEEDQSAARSLVMVMVVDSRVVYSDKVEVVAGPSGVVVNFLQNPNGPYQSQAVARVGMSREQAKKVLRVLEQTLTQSEQSEQQPGNLSTSESDKKHKN